MIMPKKGQREVTGECCREYLIKKTDLPSVCGHLRRNSVSR
jgi:hypothetical protein